MNPKSITFTLPDGTHTEYDRNFMAVVVEENGLITTATNASATYIILGTACLNAEIALHLLEERRPGLQRMLLLLRYISRWIHAFYVGYKTIAKEEHNE